LWGTDTLGYHFTNIVLHLVSAFLVWRLFRKLGLRLAWWGGLLFAIHPIMVESVAWIAELKNVLTLPFFLLSMCAWIDYDRLGKPNDYFLSLGLFLVALLCKITVVMFPVVILLYAWWKRGRIGWSDLKVSAPFFLLSLAVGLIPIVNGIWGRGFSNLGPEYVPTGGGVARLVLAGMEIAFYFSKSVFPVGLMPIYPKWPVDPTSPAQYLPWLVLAGAISWLWTKRQSWGRHALLGLGFFLINLAPCPGFIPASNMGYAWVMDHFLYLSIIGLIGLLVAGVEGLDGTLSNAARPFAIGLAVVLTALLALGGHAYAGIFGDSETLWTYAVQRNPDSWMARTNLGETLSEQGRLPEAMEQFEAALKIDPSFASAHYGRANVLSLEGRLPEAIDEYEAVLKLNPIYAAAHYDLGNAFVRAHRIQEAAEQFEKVLQINPRQADAHFALGNLLFDSNRFPEAIEQYEKSLQTDPNRAETHFALGNALLKTNQFPAAMEQYGQAAQLDPRNAEALSNLGVILARTGRFPAAMQEFEAALQIDPDNVEAHNNLGSIFLVTGRFPEAIEQYQTALRIRPDFADAQKNLARARAMEKAHGTTPTP